MFLPKMKSYFTAVLPFWCLSMNSSLHIQRGASVDGELKVDLVSGIENFKDTVLLISSSCSQLIGTEFQKKTYLEYFPRIRLEEIPESGHTMLGEQTEYCVALIRDYFKSENPKR